MKEQHAPASPAPNDDGSPSIMLDRLRQTEERMRLLGLAIECADDGVIITTADRNAASPVILFVNAGVCRLTGYSTAELVGRPLNILQHNRGAAKEFERLQRELSAGQRYRGEMLNHRKDGSELWLEWYACPVLDASGRTTHYIAIQRDISDRKLREDALRHSQKYEALGQLAGGVAHDFNNLLTVIFGYTARAAECFPPDHPASAALQHVDEAARHASGVASALLAFGRRASTEKKIINLREVADESCRLLRRMLPAGVEIVLDNPAQPLLRVDADAAQLQQVLINLALHARDAMPHGGQLQITLRPAADRGAAELVVEDGGTAIPPEALPHIFEPYFATSDKSFSAGLGLAIVDSIVREHGGKTVVHTKPGRGTTFVITLPTVAGATAAAAAPPADADPGHGETILVAEDHEFVREIIMTVLSARGYQPLAAADGESLLALYARHREAVRLVVLDLDLPKRDGRECLLELRRAGAKVPVLVITGNANVETADWLDTGALLLQKPFQVAELGRLVGTMLRGA